jgi:hypothetical protein
LLSNSGGKSDKKNFIDTMIRATPMHFHLSSPWQILASSTRLL